MTTIVNILNRAMARAFIGGMSRSDTRKPTIASVRLKELASHLGVSQTTVSRALNGFPEVSEATRLRVQEAARTLHYRPSSSAASLATGKSRIIGHVVPLADQEMINPHFADVLAGTSETCERAGYDLLLRMVRPEDEEALYRDLADRRRVDGVIVHAPRLHDPRIDLLRQIGLPFVVHGRARDEDGYDWLDVNNEQAMEQATRHLIELGHRRFGFVNGLETMGFAHRRRLGYERALRQNGIDPDARSMIAGELTEPFGYKTLRTMLAMPEPPTAVLFSSILPAMGALRLMGERGLKAGHDLSIMAYDDRLSCLVDTDGEDAIALSAMRSSIRDAGTRIARMLIERIAEPDAPPKQERWEARHHAGRTVGPPPATLPQIPR